MRVQGLALLLLGASLSPAQRTVSARAGAVRLMQGTAHLDGKRVSRRRGVNASTQMHSGQRLHVDFGTLELMLGPGAEAILNEGSTVLMQENLLSDVKVVLEQGSALVKVDRVFKGGRLRMMQPGGSIEMPNAGWYRFDAASQTLRVYRGAAQVLAGETPMRVTKGESVNLGQAAAAVRFDLKQPDPLVDFENRRDREREAQQRRAYEAAAARRARGAILQDEHTEEAHVPPAIQPNSPQQ